MSKPKQSAAEIAPQTAPIDEPTVEPSDENLVEQTQPVPAESEVAVPDRPKRIWEVDFVRGLMILFVVWDHFMWDVNNVGSSVYQTGLFRWLFDLSVRYYKGSLRGVTHDVFVTMFVVTSGISCSFSRSNGRRALKMCIFALLFTGVTWAASQVLHTEMTMYFNVIHVIALSVAIYAGIEWIWDKLTANWQKNIFGVLYFALTMTVLVVGHCAKDMGIGWAELLLGKHDWLTSALRTMQRGGDYLAFWPDFGWFLVGAFLGKIVYRKRESVFPSVDVRYVKPITVCGKYSLWIYFGSQVVMYGLIYLLHEVANLL